MDFGVFALCTLPDRSDLEFLDFEVSKKVKISAKNVFSKITVFFVGSFWVEIHVLRLAHSFGLWGCLGHSKRRQFDEYSMDLIGF